MNKRIPNWNLCEKPCGKYIYIYIEQLHLNLCKSVMTLMSDDNNGPRQSWCAIVRRVRVVEDSSLVAAIYLED